MTLELSYSSEFFYAPGEPAEDVGPAINARCRPVSLYSAIAMAPEHARTWLAERYGLDKRSSDFAHRLVETAKATNTCRENRGVVEVWIDPEGECRVEVFPSDGDTDSEWLTSAEEAAIVTFHRGSLTCPNGRHFIKRDGQNVELDRVQFLGCIMYRISKDQSSA
jgi:hypothetical protein